MRVLETVRFFLHDVSVVDGPADVGHFRQRIAKSLA
jgi:hypothetical protein